LRFNVEQVRSDPKGTCTLVDISELSRRLSIAEGTLYNWVYLRRIPYVKVGRCLRFDFEKVFESLSHCPKMEEAAKR
jgi:excisionase family DNA binding protein